MDEQSSTEFFNQAIWNCHDIVSTNHFEMNLMTIADSYGIKPTRIQFVIANRKTRQRETISLMHQDVYQFLQKFKKEDIGSLFSKLTADESFNKTFSVPIKDRKIFVTFLSRIEYGPSIRLILSARNEGFLDSEKIYFKFWDFISLVAVLGNFRDNYISILSSVPAQVELKGMKEEIHQLRMKLSGLYVEIAEQRRMIEMETDNLPFDFTEKKPEPLSDEKPLEVVPIANLPSSSSTNESVIDDVQTVEAVVDPVRQNIQGDLTQFITENESTTELDIPHEEHVVAGTYRHEVQDVAASLIGKGKFTTHFLAKKSFNKLSEELTKEEYPTPQYTADGKIKKAKLTEEKLLENADLSRLEELITNLSNTDSPFIKSVEFISDRIKRYDLELCDADKLAGDSYSDQELKLFDKVIDKLVPVEYLSTSVMKYYVNLHLEKKIKIPEAVAPILIDGNELDEGTLDIVYDILLYIVFFTFLRNVLVEKDYDSITNKEMICFKMKMMLFPYLSGLDSIDDEKIIQEIRTRYVKYSKCGVFDQVLDGVKKTLPNIPHITVDMISSEVGRILESIKKNYEHLLIGPSFKRYEDKGVIVLHSTDVELLTTSTISKILVIEANWKKNNCRVDFNQIKINNTDDVPKEVLARYGLTTLQYDNTNLVRYVKSVCGEETEEAKTIIADVSDINSSFRDLRNKNIDYKSYPEGVLRAIHCWDVDKDPKIATTYSYFKEEVVERCSLTGDMIISTLLSPDDEIDLPFMAAVISNTTGT